MKIGFILILSVLAVTSTVAVERHEETPNTKDWIMITDIHFMNKRSVKQVKPNVYQARVCHSSTNGKDSWWVFFNVRVDCSSRQAWLESGKEWIRSAGSPKYIEGVMKIVCKSE